MNFPSPSDPNFQAFVTGFFLPFFSTVLGYTVFIVRNIISRVNSDKL